MTRIGVTLSGIERSLLNRLAEDNAGIALATLRLAARKRVLRPSDDPSAFVALSGLQGQLNVVTATMANVTAASSLLGQAQSAVDQIRTKLGLIRDELEKEYQQGGITPAQRTEAQTKIDAYIDEINVLATTSYDGRRVLDGSADYTTSGRTSYQVAALRVYSAGRESRPVISGEVTRAATQGKLVYTGTAGNVKAADAGTLTIAGKLGSAEVTVAAGQSLTAVRDLVNAKSHETGIVASVGGVGNNQLAFSTVHYGHSATLAVSSNGTFAVYGGHGDGTAQGADAAATINGRSFSGSTPKRPAELRHFEADPAEFANSAEIRVTGHLGSTDIVITGGPGGDSLQDAADAINAQTASTSVAAWVDGRQLVMYGTQEGSSAQINLSVLSGTFDTVGGVTSASGADEVLGDTSVDGAVVNFASNGLHFEIEFGAGYQGVFSPITVTGGAMTFQLTTDPNHPSQLAVAGMQAGQLGGLSGRLSDLASGGSASGLGANASQAIRIVDEALGQLTKTEGSVDGFYSAAVQGASLLLTEMETNLTDAITQTDGYDEEEETAVLANYEALAQNAISGLYILQQQRSAIVDMLKHIAGLT